jgi:gluconolactonase
MEYTVMAVGLEFPEGPVAMDDGSVILVEIKGRRITRVYSDGLRITLLETEGAPNGAAFGPDNALYICNNGGGFLWGSPGGVTQPVGNSPAYSGGRIERFDLETGVVTELYRKVDANPLLMPNDIVFDREGGFYFTDHGSREARRFNCGGVYYGRIDGSLVKELVFPIVTANGVGLSPDEKTLYVAETETGRLYSYRITAPGEIVAPNPADPGGPLLAQIEGFKRYDSLAVEENGNICVAGLTPGSITVISPEGKEVECIAMPDELPTNICFGDEDMRTAYVTLSGSGRLIRMRWPRPGLRLNFQRF